MVEHDDELIPMAQLGWQEQELCRLLARWLPPVVGPSGEQLLELARAPAQERLADEEEEHA